MCPFFFFWWDRYPRIFSLLFLFFKLIYFVYKSKARSWNKTCYYVIINRYYCSHSLPSSLKEEKNWCGGRRLCSQSPPVILTSASETSILISAEPYMVKIRTSTHQSFSSPPVFPAFPVFPPLIPTHFPQSSPPFRNFYVWHRFTSFLVVSVASGVFFSRQLSGAFPLIWPRPKKQSETVHKLSLEACRMHVIVDFWSTRLRQLPLIPTLSTDLRAFSRFHPHTKVTLLLICLIFQFPYDWFANTKP